MINAIIASSFLLTIPALAQGLGSANVVNMCNYDVYLVNMPSLDGGQAQIGPEILSTGDAYSQVYTELADSGGWSLKLAMSASFDQVLQYEYTFQNSGTVWFDLSQVNGSPWNGNWLLSATGDCSPEQVAYQYPTDDSGAMQTCPDTSTITLTLCPSSGT